MTLGILRYKIIIHNPNSNEQERIKDVLMPKHNKEDLYTEFCHLIPEIKWLHPNRYVIYDLDKSLKIFVKPFGNIYLRMFGRDLLNIDKSLYTECLNYSFSRLYGVPETRTEKIIDAFCFAAAEIPRPYLTLTNLMPGLGDICCVISNTEDQSEYCLVANNLKGSIFLKDKEINGIKQPRSRRSTYLAELKQLLSKLTP